MKLSNPSQLALKNSNRLPRRLLVINPDADGLDRSLTQQGKEVTLLSGDFLNVKQLQQQGAKATFDATGQSLNETDFDGALIRIPKSREQLNYLAYLATTLLPSNSPLFMVGENKGGIRTAAKTVARHLGPVNKLASGSHCQLLCGTTLAQPEFDLAPWEQPYSVETPDGPLALTALPGVFSHGELDPGTALLLEHLPKAPKGRVLDFGCGDGVIGAFLARRNPGVELEMVDINAMALAASERSLIHNGLTGRVYASDGLSDVSGQFDLIVSNPPFHHGNDQTFDTARAFIRDAARHLAPGGRLIIVANHHLPYGDDLAQAFGQVNIVAQNNKFKIYANAIS